MICYIVFAWLYICIWLYVWYSCTAKRDNHGLTVSMVRDVVRLARRHINCPMAAPAWYPTPMDSTAPAPTINDGSAPITVSNGLNGTSVTTAMPAASPPGTPLKGRTRFLFKRSWKYSFHGSSSDCCCCCCGLTAVEEKKRRNIIYLRKLWRREGEWEWKSEKEGEGEWEWKSVKESEKEWNLKVRFKEESERSKRVRLKERKRVRFKEECEGENRKGLKEWDLKKRIGKVEKSEI